MKIYKRFLTILLIFSIILPVIASAQVYATNGAATIHTDRDNYSYHDIDGNRLVWKNIRPATFLDQQKNYDNLYCVDAGITRETNYKVIEERYIIDYLNIDTSTKGSIFENAVDDYNSMLWFSDNMYLWQYDSTNLSSDEIKQLKLANVESIKNIILSQKDYLQSLDINIDKQWLDDTFVDIDTDQSSSKVYANNFHEDMLVQLNKAIIWQIARNTLGGNNNDNVDVAENLVKHHIEFDGNVLCLSEAEANLDHYDIYESSADNKNIQKAFKAYYYAMLKTAQENKNYTRYEEIDINTSSAKTNLEENKIGPFTFNNYNKNYIEGYTLTVNDAEISKDLYTIEPNQKGEFFITLDKSILNKDGNYNISVTVKYNYGTYRNAYLIDNPYPGYQPLLSVNYNNIPSLDSDVVTADITIKETTNEIIKEYPNIKVTKTADKTVVSEGDEVTYTVLIENNGNVDLSNVIVKDEMLEIDKTIETLKVGQSESVTGIYVVTKEDIEKEKEITNTVTVTAKHKDENLSASASATIVPKIIIKEEIEVEVEKEFPNLKVTKTADKTVVVEGDEITYTIAVENIGNVELSNIVVTDEMLNINKTIEKLGVGKSETLTGTYTVTKNDIEKEKEITNTVTVTTTYKDKQLLSSDSATIVPKIVKKEQVTVEVEKEVIKVVEKEVPVEVIKVVEKEVYVQKDSTTATTKIPKAGSKYILIFIVSITIISIYSYVFYKKSKIK